ncbi:MAG: hypothetical protein ABJA10_08465 [Aestuariivirga sp.]
MREPEFKAGDVVEVDHDELSSHVGLVRGKHYVVAEFHEQGPSLSLVGNTRTQFSLGYFKRVEALTPADIRYYGANATSGLEAQPPHPTGRDE